MDTITLLYSIKKTAGELLLPPTQDNCAKLSGIYTAIDMLIEREKEAKTDDSDH